MIQNYGLIVQDHKIKVNEEVRSLRSKEHKETIEQLLDRFHALRIQSGVRGSHVLISYLLRTLLSDLVRTINITFVSASTNDKNNVEFVCSTARTLHNQERSLDVAATGSKCSSFSGSVPSSTLKKSKFAPSSPADNAGNQKVKPRKFCSFHRVTTHDIEDCQARKKDEEPKVKNKCRR